MSTPEPLDVGPAAGGDLRASDADRNQVIDLLSAAYAEGRLTADEHGDRVSMATRARTFDDLVPLTRDLVPIGVPLPAATTPTATHAPVPATQAPRMNRVATRPLTLVGVLGGASRKGHWRVPSEITAYSLMGGVELDLTDAEFTSDTVTITSYACMGGMEIKVPAGVDVRDETIGILGGSEVKHIVNGPGPVIVLKGIAMMGGVEITGPGKQLARERRREQRRLQRGR
ncbi:DUF1707 SHOCT-like domain-containing protein [Mariniluteicoccus flavus]